MKKFSVRIVGGVLVGFSVSVNAGLLIDSAGKSEEGTTQVGVYYSSGETAYKDKNDSSDSAGMKKNGITVYGAYGISEKFDLYAGVTYNITTKFDETGSPDGGSGFDLGAGIRGELLYLNSIRFMGYAQLEYIEADFGSWERTTPYWEIIHKYSVSGLELSGGVIALFEINDELLMYGGLELVPFGTMELKRVDSHNALQINFDQSSQETNTFDLSRDNMFSIRLGAKYMINDEISVRGEFASVGEKSFTIGAGRSF